jgi:hypothetical protein
MKQINLFPWREQEIKSKIKQFILIWFGVSCVCFSLLFIANIVIIQQIKNYQLISQRIFFKLKNSAYKIQEMRKLKYEKKELTRIIKITQVNHYKLRKILEFLIYLEYLIAPDIFIQLIEFYPPYFILIMHSSTEKNYFKIIKSLKIKNKYKLNVQIINKAKDSLSLDFLIKMIV